MPIRKKDLSHLTPFEKGNELWKKRKPDKVIQFLRKATRAEIVQAVSLLALPVDQLRELKNGKDSEINGFEKIVLEGLFGQKHKILQYVIDQAIGRPVTPIAAKTDINDLTKNMPHLKIKRPDGSIVELRHGEDKETDQDHQMPGLPETDPTTIEVTGDEIT